MTSISPPIALPWPVSSKWTWVTAEWSGANLLPFLPIRYQGNSNNSSIPSIERPLISGTKNQQKNIPMMMTPKKKKKVPPWCIAIIIEGTAFVLPNWFAKWKVMIKAVPIALCLKLNISELIKYWIEFQPIVQPTPFKYNIAKAQTPACFSEDVIVNSSFETFGTTVMKIAKYKVDKHWTVNPMYKHFLLPKKSIRKKAVK